MTAVAVLVVTQVPYDQQYNPQLYHIWKSYLGFDNITDMYQQCELVIHGYVESSYVDARFKSDVKTRHIVDIIEVLKGNITSDMMIVTQDGGLFAGEMIRVKDEPLMNEGDEVVLFLSYSPYQESYQIAGGLQGRYLILNGKVYHITEVDKGIQFVTPWLHVNGADVNNLKQIFAP